MTGRLYDTQRWKRERAAFLRRNPLCRMCEAIGLTSLARAVDHVEPHRGNETLFWNQDNWQPICLTCHSAAKQAQERTGQIRGCDVHGRPLDPNHPWNVKG